MSSTPQPDILQGFPARAVLYVATGGEALGRRIAAQAGLPCFPMDVRYPLSRAVAHRPVLAALLFPFKEFVYRLTQPTFVPPLPPVEAPLLLVDDRAGTGRTVQVALGALVQAGIDRADVKVVVGRAGRRGAAVVDLVL